MYCQYQQCGDISGVYICQNKQMNALLDVVHDKVCTSCPLKDIVAQRRVTKPWTDAQIERAKQLEGTYAPKEKQEKVGEGCCGGNIVTKTISFLKAGAEHLVAGMPVVTDEQFAERIKICEGCPLFQADRTCGICHCPMDKKAKWAEQECPDKPPRWKAID